MSIVKKVVFKMNEEMLINEDIINKEIINDEEEVDRVNKNIYRYKFTQEFIDELYKFSKIHQYDDRKVFKEAWNEWLEMNKDIVLNETNYLLNLGYNKNILDKMFKSSKYYFRKKSTEKSAPTQRRSYTNVQKVLLDAMDKDIKDINKINYKPSERFNDFCNKNIDLLKEEVNTMCKNGFKDPIEIQKKIKKTYNNRYFLLLNIKK
jgi:bisphosphoglycerate-dependent phosphoglycerate mutase